VGGPASARHSPLSSGCSTTRARAAGELKDNGYRWSYFRYAVLPELLRSFMPT